MYLSHISLTPAAIEKSGVQAALSRGAYGHHQLLCELFDGPRNENFLFRHIDGEQGMHFYTLSRVEPNVNKEDHWASSTKIFRPILRSGKRLIFSVRINPTINRSEAPFSPGSTKRRHKRRDLIYEAVRAYRASEGRTPNRNVIAQRCGERWLGKRLERAGFSLDRHESKNHERELVVTCTAYRQHRVRKGKQMITISTLDCEGVGTVTDPVAFSSLLENGLGPAKGFGCGLMLIRPV